MLGLLLGRGLLGGGIFSSLFGLCAAISAIAVLCGCLRCMKCEFRSCPCVKRILRCTGHDEFDDFELMVLVHDATFEGRAKMSTLIRITAGSHVVKTDASSRGIFQQPLHITVEQGCRQIIVDLCDTSDRVLASLVIDVMGNILSETGPQSECDYVMNTKSKGIIKPKVKLTMVVSNDDDCEAGLLTGMSTDVDILVRQQLHKAKQEGQAHGDTQLTEMEVLKEAASGPLEVFEGLGQTHNVYVGVLGPPESRRWVFGVWKSKQDFLARKPAAQEIDLLKIETVQGDPTRHHVFVINCFDGSRNHKSLTFRRIDRARDVWVEIIHLLVLKCRAAKKAQKAQSPGGRATSYGASSSKGSSASPHGARTFAFGSR